MNTNIIPNQRILINKKTDTLISVFDDLVAHGDMDAAALAIGDIWRALPKHKQTAIANFVRVMARNDTQMPALR